MHAVVNYSPYLKRKIPQFTSIQIFSHSNFIFHYIIDLNIEMLILQTNTFTSYYKLQIIVTNRKPTLSYKLDYQYRRTLIIFFLKLTQHEMYIMSIFEIKSTMKGAVLKSSSKSIPVHLSKSLTLCQNISPIWHFSKNIPLD